MKADTMPDLPVVEAARQASGMGLRYVSDDAPGIRRRRSGRGFSYRDSDGNIIRDPRVLARIRALAIPPAYRDVWICTSERGHLQATGRDARGRKQYRYHPRWRALRDVDKFDRLVAFGRALPALRRRMRKDLALSGYPRDKVLAIVVTVMSATLMRIGNVEYQRSNRSYGLTTLRNRHASFVRGGGLRLKFRGKSGKEHDIAIGDRRLVRMVRALHQLPGQLLFQYRGNDGELQPVDSGAVNDYLRDSMGEDFTAKDFRTWGATLAAFQQLAAMPAPETPSQRLLASLEREVVAGIAEALGNTVSVCRKSYIDPCVFAGWQDGSGSLQRVARAARSERQWEAAALRYLARAHRVASKPTSRRRKPG